jgi:class 3 adenylate cyclase
MPDLTPAQRARLPNNAFAYIDSRGRRRLPIHDEAHVRNALARFGRTNFEDEAARDAARRRLLRAARRFGIVPDGFIAAQLEPHRRLPRGNVTLLMADIEGSTELLASAAEAYPRVLADVRRVMRSEVRRAGGREVDARADEYFAAFADAGAAVAAAVATQRAILARDWPAGVSLRLRMGLHAGRPTLTSAGYVGLAVNVTARICAAAHGGQIVLSAAAVAAALGDERPAGIEFEPLGEHRLRGVGQPLSLLQVVARGLPRDFPPLR